MAKVKYDLGVTPIRKEQNGFVFQNGRAGNCITSSKKNDRVRYLNQNNRKLNLTNVDNQWRNLTPTQKTAWSNFAITFPTPCKFATSGFLSGYELFVKRNYYHLLFNAPGSMLILEPTTSEILPDPLTVSIARSGASLICTPTFENNLDNILVYVSLSPVISPSKSYKGSANRFMGFLNNSGGILINHGSLYNWYSVVDPRGFAPVGWHIPSYSEMITLYNNAGGYSLIGGNLNETGNVYWQAPNEYALNIFGFNARGSGYRTSNFSQLSQYFRMWLSDSASSTLANSFSSRYNSAQGLLSNFFKIYGLGARCIKDDSTDSGTMIGNDGVIYPTVKIGSQVWQALPSIESKFRDGSDIPYISDQTAWEALTSYGMCYYDNDVLNSFVNQASILDCTPEWVNNFGILPNVGDIVKVSLLPMGKTNGQFFPEQTFNIEII